MEGEKARKRRQDRHGLSTMKRAIDRLGARAIPGNTKLAYALKKWRQDLIEDLGGEASVSVQQRTIIEFASTARLMISSVDAWIVNQPSMLTRERKIMPVVMQRQVLVDSLVRLLSTLGLERREKPVRSLEEILNGDNTHGSDEETAT